MNVSWPACPLDWPRGFPVLEFLPDNGLGFLNQILLTYWKQAVPHLAISRSRPFHKNDNPFVEEPVLARPGKNGSLVRGYIGFAPLDAAPQANLLNQIYDRMWLLHNFFHTVMRRQDYGGPTTPRALTAPCLRSIACVPATASQPTGRRLWPTCDKRLIPWSCVTRSTIFLIAWTAFQGPTFSAPKTSTELCFNPGGRFQRPDSR